MKVKFNIGEFLESILSVDFRYPVGSYYETSDGNFNPNTAWGGVWVLENPGLVHVSGGTGYAVSGANSDSGKGAKDGGSKDAIVVKHSHQVNEHTHDLGNHKHDTVMGSHSHPISGGLTTPSYAATAYAASGVQNYLQLGNVSGNTSETDLGTKTSGTPSTNTSGKASPWTDERGSAGTNANMQPYINIYRWHRTA